jgi:hypothetical protein
LVDHIVDSLENNPGVSRDYMRQQITDNGTTLIISVEAIKQGKNISYNKSFDVKGMSQSKKDAIVEDVMKQLGLKD